MNNKTRIHIGGIISHGIQHYGFKITTRNPNTVDKIKKNIIQNLKNQDYEIEITNGYYDQKEE